MLCQRASPLPNTLLKLSRRKTAIVSIDPEPIVDADTRADWHFATSSPIPLSPVQSSLSVDIFGEEDEDMLGTLYCHFFTLKFTLCFASPHVHDVSYHMDPVRF